MRLEANRDCLTCDFCGNIHVPEANADGVRVFDLATGLNCSICAAPLVHAAVAGLRIQHCTRCKGLLIPMDSMLAIVTHLRSGREIAAGIHPIDWKELDRHVRCPQCTTEMDTHPYGGGGGVVVDSCENCSLIWLDYSELDRIVSSPDHVYSDQF